MPTPRLTAAALSRAVKSYQLSRKALQRQSTPETIERYHRAAHTLAKLTESLVEQDMAVPLQLSPAGEALAQQM